MAAADRAVDRGGPLATSHTRDVDLPYPYPVVLDAIVHAAPSVRLRVSTVDPARGMVFGSRGMSFFSYGLNVTVQLGQATPTTPTRARFTSSLVFGLVDYGANRRFVEQVVGAVESWLAANAAATRIG